MAKHRAAAADPPPDRTTNSSVDDAVAALFKTARPFGKNEGTCSNALNEESSASSSAAVAVPLTGKENEHERGRPAAAPSRAFGKSAIPPRKKLVATKKRMIHQKPVRTPASTRRKAGRDQNAPHSTPFCVPVDPFAGADSNASFSSAVHSEGKSVDVAKTPSKDFIYDIPPDDTSASSSHHLHHLGHPGGMIRSGPVRIHTPHPKPVREKVPVNRRVGVDGTGRTPSKELLRSTAYSRAQKVKAEQEPSLQHGAASQGKTGLSTEGGHRRKRKNGDTTSRHVTFRGQNVPLDQSFGIETIDLADDISALTINVDNNNSVSEGADESTDSSIVRAVGTRHGPSRSIGEASTREYLGNPVAVTLLNGGEEDLQHLLETDRMSYAQPPAPYVSRDERSEHSGKALPAWPLSPIFPGRVAQGSNIARTTASLDTGRAHRTSPVQPVRAVSGNLSDVKSDSEVATLLRPKAVLARPVKVHPIG